MGNTLFTATDRDVLIKLLNDTDTVKNVFIRSKRLNQVHAFLKRFDLTWDTLLKPASGSGEGSEWLRGQNIEKVFTTILDHLEDEDPIRFINSLQAQFARRGTLTEPQCVALKKFYDNCTSTGGRGTYYEEEDDWEEREGYMDEMNGLF